MKAEPASYRTDSGQVAEVLGVSLVSGPGGESCGCVQLRYPNGTLDFLPIARFDPMRIVPWAPGSDAVDFSPEDRAIYSELLYWLGQHVGETGEAEGAVETLQRLIREARRAEMTP